MSKFTKLEALEKKLSFIRSECIAEDLINKINNLTESQINEVKIRKQYFELVLVLDEFHNDLFINKSHSGQIIHYIKKNLNSYKKFLGR